MKRSLLLASVLMLLRPHVALAGEWLRLRFAEPQTSDAELSMQASFFAGDGFWNTNRRLSNQTNTLLEQRVVFDAWSVVRNGVSVGIRLPIVRREVDLAAPGSSDVINRGFGDAEFSIGWHDRPWRPPLQVGVTGLWKPPSGRSNTSLSDADRGLPTAVALGTGGHDLDGWFGGVWDPRRFWLSAAAGYRKRLKSEGTFLFNGQGTTTTRPRERLQAQLGAGLRITRQLSLSLDYHTFKEILLFDSRRKEQGQNTAWSSWLRIGLQLDVERTFVIARWSLPALGRDYPTTPPEQFQERSPLLGQEVTIGLGVRFFRDWRKR